MTILELNQDMKDNTDCSNIVMELEVSVGKLKAIYNALGNDTFMYYGHLDHSRAASMIANHENNSNLFAAGSDYLGEALDKLEELKDELNAIRDSLKERVIHPSIDSSLGTTDKQITLCNAINAIEEEHLLDMIAKTIYGITNPKQNGERNKKASEILESVLK